MSTVNPYSPPRAAVADRDHEVTEFSTPKVWSASGRLGRLRYLAYLVIATLVLYPLMFIAGAIGGVSRSGVLMTILLAAVYIPYAVLSVLLLIQRSHDMGWSGWMSILALVPLVGLIWVFKAGTPGKNAYGAPPPPNPGVIKFFGLIGPVLGLIAVVGIMAAVSIPAYQDYVKRAKAAQLKQQAAPEPQQQ